jgi:5-methyltetrahydrofolate--homocysteine methyltransferase
MWNRVVVMDGAMGTYLSPDLINQRTLSEAHRQYLAAGADIIKTNTFCLNHDSAEAARIARKAADEFMPKRYVAASIGPNGNSKDDYYMHLLGLATADILLAETLTGIGATRMVLEACEQIFAEFSLQIPVMLSVTISQDGRLLSGETLEQFWSAVSSYKPFSVGINCSFGARHMKPHVQRLREIVSNYVSCHPSAGLPDSSGKYPESPEEWADTVLEFAESGWVDIVGGCCGTTPAHIHALARAVHQISHATIDLL